MTPKSMHRFLCLLATTFGFLSASPPLPADSVEILARRDQLDARFRGTCLEVISAADFSGDRQAYQRLLDQIRRPRTGNLLFLPGHQFCGEDSKSPDAPLSRLSRQHAAQLVELAAAALASRMPTLAYQLLHEAAFFDPGEPTARAVLGVPTTSVRAPKARMATTSHPRLPWKRRQYWRVSTAHYQIETNVGEREGLELAARMEDLHAVWRQLFFTCWSDQDGLQAAWDRKRRLQPKSRGRLRVVLFGSRDEYIEYLRPQQPRIEISLGFYDIDAATCFFFSGPESSPSTQLHEATHQLFQELQPDSPRMVVAENFWIVEGIALYLESLQRRGPCISAGGHAAERLQFARYRCLREGFYVPLEQLVALGRDALQQDPRIRRLYSQAAGLTHFLMDQQQGHYRSGLVDYLRSVYRGRARRDELALATQTEFSTLDRQYREFLNVTDRDLEESQFAVDSIHSLCLGGTSVTDTGLRRLNAQRSVEWLDLAGLPVTDAGLSFVRGSRALRQVNLERTGISDETLSWLAKCPDLEELDLSNTRVTDQGIKHLISLPKLRVLWLPGTAITDRSLDLLGGCRSLEQLDVSATRVTEAGRRRLQANRPSLQLE